MLKTKTYSGPEEALQIIRQPRDDVTNKIAYAFLNAFFFAMSFTLYFIDKVLSIIHSNKLNDYLKDLGNQ